MIDGACCTALKVYECLRAEYSLTAAKEYVLARWTGRRLCHVGGDGSRNIAESLFNDETSLMSRAWRNMVQQNMEKERSHACGCKI